MISIRKFLRWVPDEPSETTSTIALTSPGERFVDLRILDAAEQAVPNDTAGAETLPLERLDWAMAGTVTTAMLDDGQGSEFCRVQFTRWIDSKGKEEVKDIGDMYSQADGTTLEKGSMVNPATGKHSPFEESWADTILPADAKCLVLQLHDDASGKRGMLMRLAGYCQAFLRDGDDISVERWELSDDAEQGWRRTVKIGNAALPCLEVLEGKALKVGEVTGTEGEAWTVVEAV